MKRFMITILVMISALTLTGIAFAETSFYPQGSTTVPLVYDYVRADYYLKPSLVLSNITDKTIQCKVRFYDQDGNDATSLGTVWKSGYTWTQLSIGTGDFEIPAHSTRWFNFYNHGQARGITGYATIEWSSSDTMARKALIGKVWNQRKTSINFTDTFEAINNGQPF